ncbi:uncharacterized protein LOC121428360 [Lytechinus variegatus]|uniref:uncharacterized protein LOC121428360 n=1 Tax=Lytechinus variegatus TaxID=7654 RepID=UPI001BB1E768|nr:uncharacterized protein LOC121428360 [Lytechinus variegatus]
MAETQSLKTFTKDQNEIFEAYCQRIDQFLLKFKKSRSLSDLFIDDDIFEMVDQLVTGDVKSAIIAYLSSCHEVFDIFLMVWKNLTELNASTILKLTIYICNLTNYSEEFSFAIGEKGLLPLLFIHLQKKDLGEYQIGGLLTIIYNCCWKAPENRVICREFIDILQIFVQSENTSIQADAFLALSYIVDKSEVHKISLNEPCLNFILLALESAMSAQDWEDAFGYSTLELLQGLNQLAINDSNKLLIVNLGGKEILERILTGKGSSDEEKLWAARGVWQMAFKEENKVKIRKSTTTIEALKRIEETTDHCDVKEACAGALFVINEVSDIDGEFKAPTHTRKDQREVSPGKETDGHVMISYQHKSRDRMLKVKSYLEGLGYDVWMDVDRMEGDILDSMAKAVQRAAVVLVCMTRKFKESQHCRTEATYAYTLNKDIIPLMLQDQFAPEDWLGALVGMKKYYSLFSDDLMKEALPDLVRDLGNRGKCGKLDRVAPSLDGLTESSLVTVHGLRQTDEKAGDDVDCGGLTDSTVGNEKLLHSSSYTKSAHTCIATWNVEETTEWLRSQGVDTNNDSFKKVDGTRLRQIKNLLNLAPEFCLKSLKEELGLSLWDVLSLVEALENLEF